MNNIIRKRLLIFFIFILIFSLLIPSFLSCAEKGEQSGITPTDEDASAETTEEATVDLRYVDEVPKKDFAGREFVVLVNPDPSFRHFYDVNAEKITGEPLNDAVYNRNAEVEQELGIKIIDRQDKNATQTITKSVNAGTVDFSAAWVIITDHVSISQKNILLDMNKLPNIDTKKHYWDQNVVRDFTIKNKLFGLMGDISTSVSVFTHLFGVNKTIAEANGINMSELYQTVRDGKWTLDKLYSTVKGLYKDIDGDGTRNYADQYGLGVSPAIVNAAFSASGEKWVVRDDDGGFKLTDFSSTIADVYNKIAEICSDKEATLATWNIGKVTGNMRSSEYEYVYYDKFMNNTVLFTDIDVGIVMDYRKLMDYDFGIVPLPKYSEQGSYSVYAYPFYPLISVPVNYDGDAESLDFIGAVLEKLAARSYKYLTPAFYDVAMTTKFTRDEESVEMLDIALRSRIYDYMNIFNFGQMDSNISAQVQKGEPNIASIYEKFQAKAVTAIDKLTEAYSGIE